jgi:hypothetical protein
LGWSDHRVEIDEDGFGDFVCGGCSVSVFVNEAAEGRELFGKWYAFLSFLLTVYSEGAFKIDID